MLGIAGLFTVFCSVIFTSSIVNFGNHADLKQVLLYFLWRRKTIISLYRTLTYNLTLRLSFSQRCLVLLSASYRSLESRNVSAIRVKLAKSRRDRSKYCAWYVPIGTSYYPGHPSRNSSHWYRMLIRRQEIGSSLHFCVSRSDRQLCRLHDFLSSLPVAYIRGIQTIAIIIWIKH